jgi:hypothetical protein
MKIVFRGEMEEALAGFCRETGRAPDEVVHDAMRYVARDRLARFRAEFVPCAREAGFHTDEDVFAAVS